MLGQVRKSASRTLIRVLAPKGLRLATLHSSSVQMQPARGTIGITGCSGIIGSRVSEALIDGGWEVVGIANSRIGSQGGPGVDSKDETHPHLIDIDCDLSSPDCLDQDLFEGCSHVLHLAGIGSPEAPFEQILEHNIRATYHVLEAAKRSSSVKRVVLASSNHAQHGLTITDPADFLSIDHCATNSVQKMKTTDDPFPDSFYGAAKLHNESLGKLYSRVQKHFEVVALRIGWVLFDDPRALTPAEGGDYLQSVFLSKRDCVGFVRAALEADLPAENKGYACVYATSNNSKNIFDLDQTIKTLGYKPQDSADDFS